jgi:methanogenic corrinoid protein MtbC1
METGDSSHSKAKPRGPEIKFLVESALRIISLKKNRLQPHTHQDWVDHLTEALMSDADAPYQAIVASMMSRGISSEDILQIYVPAAALMMGELWVEDRASFVDVTVGSARLQKLFRNSTDEKTGGWPGRSVPLGDSILMVIPPFEDHSLGAFVVADDLRRHGIWVHMSIGLDEGQLTARIEKNHFSAIGISLATLESAQKMGAMIKCLRERLDHVPPIVVGGRAVEMVEGIVSMIGADFAVRSTREVIEKCDLSSVSLSAGNESIVNKFE